MEFIKDLNGVQYGDYEGFASVDTHTGVELHDFCKQKGINVDKYFPIGFNICDFERIGQNDIYLAVYLIDTSIAGGNYDEIEKYIKKELGKINLIKKSVPIKYSELSTFIKRFDITVFNTLRDIIQNVDINEID